MMRREVLLRAVLIGLLLACVSAPIHAAIGIRHANCAPVPVGFEERRTQSYAYDGLRNLTAITYPSGRVVSYAYKSAAPMQLDRVTDALTQQDIVTGIGYHPSGQMNRFTYGNGVPTVDYLYLAGKIVAKYDWTTGSLTYFHHDLLGNTVAQTDASGAVVMEADYRPYGAVAPTGTASEKRLYTGKERDATGLDYFGARYYDASLGRFLAVDPAGPDQENPQSFNRYAYCFNNPYKYLDPDGEQPGDVYLFNGGTVIGNTIAALIPGPYGHAAIEVSGNKVLSSGLDENGQLRVYIKSLKNELTGRSYDKFTPNFAVDDKKLDAFAELNVGKDYLPLNECSQVVANAIMAAENKKSFNWSGYGIVSPGDIGSDPVFKKKYHFDSSVKYIGKEGLMKVERYGIIEHGKSSISNAPSLKSKYDKISSSPWE